MMESRGEIARVVSQDKGVDDADSAWASTTDHCSASSIAGAFPTTPGGSARLIEISQRGEQLSTADDKVHLQSSSMDGDSQEAPGVTMVSHRGTTVQSTDVAEDLEPQGRPYSKLPIGPSVEACDTFRQDYYILPKRCKKERRMSSLSMGSAKASRNHRDRYVNLEEQYEMLKLHHLNLLNEIHETALMLNLFEQRQLIREQQAKMRQIQNLPLLDIQRGVRGNPPRAKISDDEQEEFVDENGTLSKKRPFHETNSAMNESNKKMK